MKGLDCGTGNYVASSKTGLKLQRNAFLTVDGDHIKCLSKKDPKELPWDELDIHVVIEATGLFRLQEELNKHLSAGSRRVILTVPPKDSIDATVVLGVNDHILTGNEKIVSNASCTTNCAAVLCLSLIHI